MGVRQIQLMKRNEFIHMLEDLNFTLDLTENADINEENIKLINVILMKSVISQENLRCPKYERNLIKSFLC